MHATQTPVQHPAAENSKAEGYGKVAKWLHWGMALMLFVMIAVGTYVSGLEQNDPARMQLLGMHKSFGAIFMQLAVFRLIWSRIHKAPALPAALSGWEQMLSRLITALLYLLMLAIPFSGYAMTNFAGYPMSLFGLVDLPVLFEKNPPMIGMAKQAHVVLVYTMMLALVLHIAGALKHRFMDASEADVLSRMT